MLLIPFLVFIYYAYQYKNPYILLGAGVIAVLLGTMFYNGTIFVDDGSKMCQTVIANTTVISNVTSYNYTNYCYIITNNRINYSQTIIGSLFMIFALYFIFQAGIGTLYNKKIE